MPVRRTGGYILRLKEKGKRLKALRFYSDWGVSIELKCTRFEGYTRGDIKEDRRQR
jgi:hypothetical protein